MIKRIPRIACSAPRAGRQAVGPLRSAPCASPISFAAARSGPPMVQARLASTQVPGGQKGFRVSYLFGGLVGLGMLVTIYGLYVSSSNPF
jgi:hypothetical protein